MPSSRPFWKLAASGFLLSLALLAPNSAKADQEIVRVYLDDPWQELEQNINGRWEVACVSPCDRDLPAGYYRLAESELPEWRRKQGMRDSDKMSPVGEPFYLDASRGRTIHIGKNHGRSTLKGLGTASVVVGSLGLTAGLLAMFIDAFHCLYNDGYDKNCDSDQRNLEIRDGVIAGAGFAAIVGGVVMLYQGGKQNPVLVTPDPSPEAAKIRRPIWRPIEGEAGRHAGAGPTITLFTGRF